MVTKKYKKLSVTEDVNRMVNKDCRAEFLKHHPELSQMRISENKIVYEIAKYYLEH